MHHRISRISTPRLAVALAAVLSAACIRTRTDPITGKVDVDVESPLKRGEDWKAAITGSGPFAGATGQGRAAVLSGQSTITVSLSGLTGGRSHSWRVHEGKCAGVGALFGPSSAYADFTVAAGGTAEAVARVSSALDEAKQYSVRIYAAPGDTTTLAACGDLSDSA